MKNTKFLRLLLIALALIVPALSGAHAAPTTTPQQAAARRNKALQKQQHKHQAKIQKQQKNAARQWRKQHPQTH